MNNIETDFFSFDANTKEMNTYKEKDTHNEVEMNIEEELNNEVEMNIEEDDNNEVEMNSYKETEINTEIELATKNIKTEKLKIKLLSNDTPYIFTKVKKLYEYIKLNSIKKNEYYVFEIKKNYYNLFIYMRNHKKILNYILTYHVEYDIIK